MLCKDKEKIETRTYLQFTILSLGRKHYLCKPKQKKPFMKKKYVWVAVALAIGIKAMVMALGLLGFANMWLAVFADSGVAMLCVLNSIRLLYKKQRH